MKPLKALCLSFLLFVVILPSWSPVLAADIRGEENIEISDEDTTLDNPYLFGGQVDVSVPVRNDLVTAGGNVRLDNDVSGSIWAAGGDVEIASRVGNSVRVAGGNVTISGPITEDLIVLGGSVRVTEEASISGDVIFMGGQLRLDAPVGGYVIANGGEITLNSQIRGNVSGEMGKLTLGNDAQIGGDLTYTAEERASIDQQQVAGRISYQEATRAQQAQDEVAGLITAGTIYKLIADFLFALLFLWLLRPLLTRVIGRIDGNYLKSGGLGFAILLLTPMAGLFMLVLPWLGVSVFLLYGLLIIASMAVMKLYLGWKTLTWWEKRNDREYVIDWKAALVGVMLIFILGLIPVLGWIAVFLLFLFSLGGLTMELFTFLTPSPITSTTTEKKVTSRKK